MKRSFEPFTFFFYTFMYKEGKKILSRIFFINNTLYKPFLIRLSFTKKKNKKNIDVQKK
jgi:hypothetical protein